MLIYTSMGKSFIESNDNMHDELRHGCYQTCTDMNDQSMYISNVAITVEQ